MKIENGNKSTASLKATNSSSSKKPTVTKGGDLRSK